jgi:hypothetical protein
VSSRATALRRCSGARWSYPRVIASKRDSAFAGYMILALYEAGVGDIVSINDCWLIASDARPARFTGGSA